MNWLFALLMSTAQAQDADAAKYLIFSSHAACLTRSRQMCQVMHCDGVNTVYWWDCSTGPMNGGLVGPTAVLTGSYAMRVHPTGQFAMTATNAVSVGVQGLTPLEQSKVVSSSAIAPLVAPNAVP